MCKKDIDFGWWERECVREDLLKLFKSMKKREMERLNEGSYLRNCGCIIFTYDIVKVQWVFGGMRLFI